MPPLPGELESKAKPIDPIIDSTIEVHPGINIKVKTGQILPFQLYRDFNTDLPPVTTYGLEVDLRGGKYTDYQVSFEFLQKPNLLQAENLLTGQKVAIFLGETPINEGITPHISEDNYSFSLSQTRIIGALMAANNWNAVIEGGIATIDVHLDILFLEELALPLTTLGELGINLPKEVDSSELPTLIVVNKYRLGDVLEQQEALPTKKTISPHLIGFEWHSRT